MREVRRETFTPAAASALLAMAPADYIAKRLDPLRVASYTQLMRLGVFIPTGGGTLLVTDDGRLLNGLNRLTAIVLSGTTWDLMVERDVPHGGVTDFWGALVSEEFRHAYEEGGTP